MSGNLPSLADVWKVLMCNTEARFAGLKQIKETMRKVKRFTFTFIQHVAVIGCVDVKEERVYRHRNLRIHNEHSLQRVKHFLTDSEYITDY